MILRIPEAFGVAERDLWALPSSRVTVYLAELRLRDREQREAANAGA